MALDALSAVSPVDGRYRRTAELLAAHFSEGALIRYRLRVEGEYFIALCRLPLPELREVDAGRLAALRERLAHLSRADEERVKAIEREINHDVKAVEYRLKEIFIELGLDPWREFVHFGLTSQDINNTAFPLALKDAWNEVLAPALAQIVGRLAALARQWREVPMLARTHGQPASPTRVGKEIQVFVERLRGQLQQLRQVPFSAKFGGATGNFNAHHVAYPGIDWIAFADRFVNETLGLWRTRLTTQIEPYDNLAAFCDGLRRIHTVLLDLARDFWTYIAFDWFRQKVRPEEVGSSAMPHKVNPIDFENAEGNLGVANALLGHLAVKLPVSRLQRDLTDSTVIRNVGVALAHGLIAYRSLLRGLEKITLHEEALRADLEDHWEVVAEGIQTILRREGYPRPYEALKELTRTGGRITPEAIAAFIETLAVPPRVKEELRGITPHTYTGIVPDFEEEERS